MSAALAGRSAERRPLRWRKIAHRCARLHSTFLHFKAETLSIQAIAAVGPTASSLTEACALELFVFCIIAWPPAEHITLALSARWTTALGSWSTGERDLERLTVGEAERACFSLAEEPIFINTLEAEEGALELHEDPLCANSPTLCGECCALGCICETTGNASSAFDRADRSLSVRDRSCGWTLSFTLDFFARFD